MLLLVDTVRAAPSLILRSFGKGAKAGAKAAPKGKAAKGAAAKAAAAGTGAKRRKS